MDSNHRPPACQAGALTSELRAYSFEFKALDERTVYQSLKWSVNALLLDGCLEALPAVKRATRRLGILMAAPVCGLRAVRALRLAVLKVPKPTNETESPFLSDLVMPSISDSTAAAAVDLGQSRVLGDLRYDLCLFMSSCLQHGPRPHARDLPPSCDADR